MNSGARIHSKLGEREGLGLRKEEKVEGTGSWRDRDKKKPQRRNETGRKQTTSKIKKAGVPRGGENPVRKCCRALGTAWPTCDVRNVN